MKKYDNNAFFWQKVDTLFLLGRVNIEKHKGDTHPIYANMIYPVDYGHLNETLSITDKGLSVYVGTRRPATVTSLIVAVDILEKSMDVKMLVGCTEEETNDILHFLNQSEFHKTVLINRGNEIPVWGFTED
ncbi:MAG: Inorganic pyrophosphatase [Solobacterium sp.]|nr:Inorganic pyrophosphatase [Solobacterium sp.]